MSASSPRVRRAPAPAAASSTEATAAQGTSRSVTPGPAATTDAGKHLAGRVAAALLKAAVETWPRRFGFASGQAWGPGFPAVAAAARGAAEACGDAALWEFLSGATVVGDRVAFAVAAGLAATGPAPSKGLWPRLGLAAKGGRRAAGVVVALCGVGAEADAVELELAPSFAEYSPASFWSLPPAGAAAPTSAQTREPRTGFLFMPLNDLVDEHYTVYTCRYNSTRGLPGYCL